MTAWIAPPSAAPSARRRRVVVAALRAAYAWSVRHERAEAMREVSRMTGVIMEAHGPGRGPTTPTELVAALHRQLGELPLIADLDDDDAISEAVLLEGAGRGDVLSAAAQDLVCEYAVPLRVLTDSDVWLPTWTRMQADQIKHQAFTSMLEAKSQEVYVASRRFLIEHPAGAEEEIRELVGAEGVRLAEGGYSAVPQGALHRVREKAWWWPCAQCRWPMAVDNGIVRCRYRPHSAVYRITADRARPCLSRIDEGPRLAKPRARSADGAVCVADGVWRYIVVPGVSELRVHAALERLGAATALWPSFDDYDLHVESAGREFKIDVKEYRSVHRLISDLRDKPPRARVLLPKSHEHQFDTIKAALPSLSLTTESRFIARIRRLQQPTDEKEQRS